LGWDCDFGGAVFLLRSLAEDSPESLLRFDASTRKRKNRSEKPIHASAAVGTQYRVAQSKRTKDLDLVG